MNTFQFVPQGVCARQLQFSLDEPAAAPPAPTSLPSRSNRRSNTNKTEHENPVGDLR